MAGPADAYRRVTAQGLFRNDRETFVQAVTVHGPGYWVLTPLVGPRFTVLVNRGFVPAEKRADHDRPAGPVTVTGLIRITEPKGAFLRSNDPAGDRWYSRDVAAIAAAKTLGPVVPYFIDADASPNPGGYPVGGLTVGRRCEDDWYGLPQDVANDRAAFAFSINFVGALVAVGATLCVQFLSGFDYC